MGVLCAALVGVAHPLPAAASDPSGTMYVTEFTTNVISVFAPGASGNASPSRTIVGAATGINGPNQLIQDGSGNIWLANQNTPSVTEYAPGATGNAAPINTISGAATGLVQPQGLLFDSSGNLYVANGTGNSVTEYAPGASGNAAPTRTISGAATGLNLATGLAFDSSGNLYVSNGLANSVTVYAPGASGNATPIRTISGALTTLGYPGELIFDGSGNLYVPNSSNNNVTEFASGANGNVAPTRTITGAATGLGGPDGVCFDSSGNLYVANYNGNSVLEFAPGASGNATPTKTISGAATGLNGPDLGFVVSASATSGQVVTVTVGVGTLQVSAPGSAVVLASTAPGGTTPATALGTISYVDTLNDTNIWSVTLASTDIGSVSGHNIPCLNLTVVPGAVTPAVGASGAALTPGSSSAMPSYVGGTDAIPGTTLCNPVTLTSNAATQEGYYTQVGTIQAVVPVTATTSGSSAPATMVYTITG